MYITAFQKPKYHQVTFEDILLGRSTPQTPTGTADPSATITRSFPATPAKLVDAFVRERERLVEVLRQFNETHSALFEADRQSLYRTYHIPKRTGGLRQIDEPNPRLMEALRQLRSILENDFCALHHTAAYAYVKGRSTVDAVKRHQLNKSRWFLKTDFSNFFGSTTEDFLFSMVSQIYPFNCLVRFEPGRQELRKALSLCFLNGGLPQGTPISPPLTNLMMIPIDHAIAQKLWKENYVYTRYADDIIISHRQSFSQIDVCEFIESVLRRFNAPFRIKPEKTRYGSSAGRNWNLGVMLNAKGDITIGWKRKKELKAMLTNFVRDLQSGVHWDKHDLQVLSGLIAYYVMVEPDYIRGFMEYFNKKHNVLVRKLIRDELR